MTTLTVLGTAAPYPLPDRPCSGYLLAGGGAQVWMDAGPGSLAELLRHTTLDQLDAVWISHLHLDHVGDLLNAYYALAYGLPPPLARPLPVYAPAALGKRLTGFFEQDDAGFVSDVLELRERTPAKRPPCTTPLSRPERLLGVPAYGGWS
jgi:ribonuclease BN (tRNA processing enzyme)